MEPSPLTQDSRPETFQPKIVTLYDTLFAEDEPATDHLTEGYWQEFFLLKPEPTSLKQILAELDADGLLHLQSRSQELLRRAIQRIKAAAAPSDVIALDTLTVFLGAVLSKKYTNPSSDILSVLAGLDEADVVLPELVDVLDKTIRNGRNMEVRQKAVRAALSITSGAYHTGLISYFTHRDLFPALMKCIHESESTADILRPFVLLGILSNYNKFEFQNPYRLRLDDFVNEAIIKKIISCIGSTCASARDKYIAIQDDMPEGWSLSSTLSLIGLGSRPSTPVPTAEEAKTLFGALPGPEAAILLSTFDFANANKLFCFNLVTMPAESKTDPPPLSALLSLTSYLFQHAHRSPRATLYTYLTLYILQVLIEDQVIMKRLCSEESRSSVRLCRQRQPYLPLAKGERVAATVILDLMVDGINHNLRRRLDVEFYILCLGILLRTISFLGRSRIRLAYHWSELWRTLLSFMKFLVQYSSDVRSLPRWSELVESLANVIALALSTGESFLPDTASYDDLFYKLVEAGETLTKFRDAYSLSKAADNASSIQTLISVSKHYYALLEGPEKGKVKSKNLSPREVARVIKQGYDTLSIQAKEGLDHWERFREVDHKNMLKRIAKVAVEDAKALVEQK